MKHLILLIVLLAATYASGEIVYRCPEPREDVHLVESTDNSKLIEFNLSSLECFEIELECFGAGSVFRIPCGGGFLAAVGSPDLPVIRRMVLIPPSGNIELEIVSEENPLPGPVQRRSVSAACYILRRTFPIQNQQLRLQYLSGISLQFSGT